MALRTPKYDLREFPHVYEPSEDSFLLLDALESDTAFLLNLRPQMAVEIGSGSGIVVTALSFILQNTCLYVCTDVNQQACLATKYTADLNNVPVECLNTNLLYGFKHNSFDLILFNPPYVVTESEEIAGSGLNRAWAGGVNGREVIDKLLRDVPLFLTRKGVLYLVLLKENKPQEVVRVMKGLDFTSEIVLQRKIPGEQLYVYRFFKVDE